MFIVAIVAWLNRRKFSYEAVVLEQHGAAQCPLIGTFPICESPKIPAEPSSTRCWAVNPKFERAIPLMELRHSEVLGSCLEEAAEGFFPRQKSEANAAQTANDYARLSIPLSTRFRSLKKWTWGEPGVGSVHRGVHLAAQDVSVLAAVIRSEPWGRKHWTGAAVVVPDSLHLHLYFIKTDFMTGIFFLCAPASDFMGCFTLPLCPAWFHILKPSILHPENVSRKSLSEALILVASLENHIRVRRSSPSPQAANI